MKNIAVIGAGVMGCDLAMELASYGYDVILKDISQETLRAAEKRMRTGYKFIKMMRKDFPPLDELLSRIEFRHEYGDFEPVEAVIENVTEDYEIKERVYKELNSECREDILFGVNTSCIPITRIAHLMRRPENVIGMHFLNPVPLKNLVEVIKTDLTSEVTLERAQTLLKSMNKTWVVVKDAAGFVTNRVLMLTINECFWVLHDKIAEAGDVDMIFKLGFGHKMGPLATAVNVHFAAATPNFKILEYHLPGNNHWLDEPYVPRDGFLELRDRPGLGVEVDEETISKDSYIHWQRTCPIRPDGSLGDARRTALESYPDAGEKVKIVQLSDPIPNDTVSFRADLPQDVKDKLIAAILAMTKTDEGIEVLGELYNITGLVPASDSDYDVVRKMGDLLGFDFEKALEEE